MLKSNVNRRFLCKSVKLVYIHFLVFSTSLNGCRASVVNIEHSNRVKMILVLNLLKEIKKYQHFPY